MRHFAKVFFLTECMSFEKKIGIPLREHGSFSDWDLLFEASKDRY